MKYQLNGDKTGHLPISQNYNSVGIEWLDKRNAVDLREDSETFFYGFFSV